MENHRRWFEEGVHFLEHVMSFLQLDNVQQNIYVVWRFFKVASNFTAEEVTIFNEFNSRTGSRQLHNRDTTTPD